MNKFRLKLYITGQTLNSQRALINLQRLCENELAGQYELTVIDVREHPALAEKDRIVATPTLVRELPPPMRRLIGSLSETEQVLMGLSLQSA